MERSHALEPPAPGPGRPRPHVGLDPAAGEEPARPDAVETAIHRWRRDDDQLVDRLRRLVQPWQVERARLQLVRLLGVGRAAEVSARAFGWFPPLGLEPAREHWSVRAASRSRDLVRLIEHALSNGALDELQVRELLAQLDFRVARQALTQLRKRRGSVAAVERAARALALVPDEHAAPVDVDLRTTRGRLPGGDAHWILPRFGDRLWPRAPVTVERNRAGEIARLRSPARLRLPASTELGEIELKLVLTAPGEAAARGAAQAADALKVPGTRVRGGTLIVDARAGELSVGARGVELEAAGARVIADGVEAASGAVDHAARRVVVRALERLRPASLLERAALKRRLRSSAEAAALRRLLGGDWPAMPAGAPLPSSVAEKLSGVVAPDAAERARVHTDAEAAQLAETAGARAITSGDDIFFGPEQFKPSTPEGDELIAHEVTHVEQAEREPDKKPSKSPLDGGAPADGFEVEAEHAAAALRRREELAETRAAAAALERLADEQPRPEELLALARTFDPRLLKAALWRLRRSGDAFAQLDRLADGALARLVGGRPEPLRGEPVEAAAPEVRSAARTLQRAAGEPLPEPLRPALEGALGAPLADVRVHRDAPAARAAGLLAARAFAVGPHVFFAAGAYDPSSPSGLRLLAHELAHAVQQRAGGPLRAAPAGRPQAKLDLGHSTDPHELEADAVAEEVLARLGAGERGADGAPGGSGGGRALSLPLRAELERAFGWDFGAVRLCFGVPAEAAARTAGARAFTEGARIVFGRGVDDPESPAHRALLVHELAHVVQQEKSAGRRLQRGGPAERISPSSAPRQNAPTVTGINFPGLGAALELGVGRTITAVAQVAPGTPFSTALDWTLTGAPATVTVVGTGRTVQIRAGAAVAGAPVGGTTFTVQAALRTSAADNFASPAITLVEITGVTFTAAPAFLPSVTFNGFTSAPPGNSADPNRQGVSGNTAVPTVASGPGGRPFSVLPLGAPFAGVSGTSVRPGIGTGTQNVRVSDTATRTTFDGPLLINAVPTRVSGFGASAGPGAGNYGATNNVNFAFSDGSGASGRPVAEVISVLRDDFGFGAPFGGAGAPALGFSAPDNSWNDLNTTQIAAVDVNNFVGPGVPQLPRLLLFRQQFFWMSWNGTFSSAFDTGLHRRTLMASGGGFIFRTEQIFPGGSAPVQNDPYAAVHPLIVLSAVTSTPNTPGATALAADGVSTANLTVTTTVPGRAVNWSVLFGGGSLAITTGAAANPVASPAVVTATTTPGLARVRAADTAFANRRDEANINVAAVVVRNLVAPRTVASGTSTATVSVTADPGGRNLDFTVDAAATAAGVVVSAPTIAGNVQTVTVTAPAGFTGTVTLTAADHVLAGKNTRGRIRFL